MAQDFMRSATLLAGGNTTQAALQAAESAIEYWLPGLGDDGPEWLSRFEFEWDVQEDDKPEFSILTVQPLYQSDNKRDTFFTQLRIARDYTFGKHRVTTNAGVGYRRLVADNTVLLGANAFFDHEWKVDHSRAGVGAEARWAGLDLYANYYKALSGKHGAGTDTFEEALDGFDVELTAQVPYLPWARVRGQYFVWDAPALGEDINGYTGSIELDVHQNLQFEAGYSDDDFNDGTFFAQFRFIPGNRKRPVLLSDHAIADQAFDLRDMRGHTLDKVRRVNTIVLERTSSGVTISRLN
ncbi:MAG: inverse autotransporter beta domain-containing protein [Proteobacteria bacterium]|nr:inverse autotransporter beta domain-containing protein [Pseudomonadota bacterium]